MLQIRFIVIRCELCSSESSFANCECEKKPISHHWG